MADAPEIDPPKISIPQHLVYARVVFGLAPIFFGIGLWSFGRGSCVGFGLVLASMLSG
jgi:hypothetical protein